MITQQLFKNRDSINSEICHQVASITPSGPLDQLENKSVNLPADGSVFPERLALPSQPLHFRSNERKTRSQFVPREPNTLLSKSREIPFLFKF